MADKEPAQRVYETVQRHVTRGLFSQPWNDKHGQQGTWSTTAYGLNEVEKNQWRAIARELGLT